MCIKNSRVYLAPPSNCSLSHTTKKNKINYHSKSTVSYGALRFIKFFYCTSPFPHTHSLYIISFSINCRKWELLTYSKMLKAKSNSMQKCWKFSFSPLSYVFQM
jgi:hypothetical protein